VLIRKVRDKEIEVISGYGREYGIINIFGG